MPATGSRSRRTLLAYLVKERKSFFFDSIPGSGSMLSATKAKGKLDALFGRDSTLQARKGPRQRNGSDCGVFVLATAEFVCRLYRRERSLETLSDSALHVAFERTSTHDMRNALRQLITQPSYEAGSPGIL
jgi:hypothetical protein